MTNQDIVNQLQKYEQSRQKHFEASYERLLHNKTLQALMDDLQEFENE